MSLLQKLLTSAAVLVATACVSVADAGPIQTINLGPAGRTIDPFTPIPLPPLPPSGPGAFHFVFENDGIPMGHIELITPTHLFLTVDPASAATFGFQPFFFYLTDMSHNPLTGTERDGQLGVFDPGTALGLDNPLVVPTGPPIDPLVLEQGRYFHDIHFEFEFPLDPPPQLWLFFDQPVITDTWVPEPSSFAALASLGAMGLCFGRRRRKQAA